MPQKNNFDLIRLVAALQVALFHSSSHLVPESADSPVFQVASLFPGVPVFFFISGFLISKSYEKNPELAGFARNRVLRVFPGLYVCFLVSIILVWLTGYFSTITPGASQVVVWVCAQLSFLQFYNPDFLRGYGVGVLNGSLWTISVELQFYLLLPMLYGLLRVRRVALRFSNISLTVVALVFLVVNQLYIAGASLYSATVWYKLAGVSFAPWLYMFLAGVLAQRNFVTLYPLVGGKFLFICVAYVVGGLLGTHLLGWQLGNSLNPMMFAGVCALVLATAFSLVGLSDKILGRNDFSYGVYIYHMPVVNLLLALGYGGHGVARPLAMTGTVLLAFFSWRWVERPALRLKRHPLYDHDAVSHPASS